MSSALNSGSIVFFMEIFCHIYNVLITDNPIMDISTSLRSTIHQSFLYWKKTEYVQQIHCVYLILNYQVEDIPFIFRKRQ